MSTNPRLERMPEGDEESPVPGRSREQPGPRMPAPAQYSEEDARAILKRAVDLSGDERGFSRGQLAEMATELGITHEALLAAEQSWLAERAEEQERREFIAHRRHSFKAHLAVYLIINTFLFLLNVVVSFGEWWFIFPLLGWGIGLAIHGFVSLQTGGDNYEQEFERWRRRRVRRPEARLPR